MILRAEKGYRVVGKDTDGTTMPQDLGVTGPRDQRKDEYVGKRSLFTAARGPDRKQLVGLAVASGAPLPTGAHVIEGLGKARRSLGYVTSSYFSPTLERPVALGLVDDGAARMGRVWPHIISAPSGASASPRRSRSIRRDGGFMRETNWASARRAEGPLVARPGFSATARTGLGQTLISGDLDAALQALAPGAPLLGLHAQAPEGGHALRIARDRALLVTPAPLGAADGWRDGFCATAVDDAWIPLDVEGPEAPLVLMQGTAADLAAVSPSAALLFAGQRGLLARTLSGFRPACRTVPARGAARLARRGVILASCRHRAFVVN